MSRELSLILDNCLRELLLFRVCVLLPTAMTYELDLDIRHFDIEQGFVQSDMEENMFMRLPQGCGKFSGEILRLNKSLSGIKQASRHWHAHLTGRLLTSGFM